MSDKCPTCGLTDGQYNVIKTALCNDPWHADAHLRTAEIVNRNRRAIDEDRPTTIRMRAETSRRCFEDMLEHFVSRHAPRAPHLRDEFQRDLMMLFRDAMEHKSMVYGMHMERTETVLSQLSMAATSATQAIFETEAQRQTREMRQREFEIARNIASQPKKED